MIFGSEVSNQRPVAAASTGVRHQEEHGGGSQGEKSRQEALSAAKTSRVEGRCHGDSNSLSIQSGRLTRRRSDGACVVVISECFTRTRGELEDDPKAGLLEAARVHQPKPGVLLSSSSRGVCFC